MKRAIKANESKNGFVTVDFHRIMNTSEKPNAVGAAISKVKLLHELGWTKKEIDCRFVTGTWTGLDFSGLDLVGSKIAEALPEIGKP